MPDRRRDGWLPRGVVIALVVIVLLVVALVGAKVLADRSAATQMDSRTDELVVLLDGASPRDFLAFNAGRHAPGSVAKDTADQVDFVSVNARADRALIRFQPTGWWQGFTERCVVAVVTDSGVQVDQLKTACVRIDPATYGDG